MLIAYFWLCGNKRNAIATMSGQAPKAVGELVRQLRTLVSSNVHAERVMIGGPGVVVEIDESVFAKRKYHRGHRVNEVWVFGGVERTEERRMFAEGVPNRTAVTLLEVLERSVHPGSMIHSDCWAAYNGIERLLSMTHRTVNHSRHFTDPDTGVHTNTVEGTWNGIKYHLKTRSRARDGLQSHLMEFCWRRQNATALWACLLQCLKETAFK
jgi:hypothetical protein